MTKVKVFVYGRRQQQQRQRQQRRGYDNSSPDFRHGELKKDKLFSKMIMRKPNGNVAFGWLIWETGQAQCIKAILIINELVSFLLCPCERIYRWKNIPCKPRIYHRAGDLFVPHSSSFSTKIVKRHLFHRTAIHQTNTVNIMSMALLFEHWIAFCRCSRAIWIASERRAN